MYKIVPNPRNNQCTITMNRWELRTDENEFIGCFAREEVAKKVREALEKYYQEQVKEINYFSWYNPNREEKVFSFNGASAAFVWIPPGEFMMGSPDDEPIRFKDEGPQHLVRFISGFWMQTTPVTQTQWQVVMGNNPSYFQNAGPDAPVEQVSWNDAKEFIRRLSGIIRDVQLRLPTEAEWEYACRADTTALFWTGRCLNTDQANYDDNYPIDGCPKGEYRQRTTPVNMFPANPWGLHDIHGNVWEWCEDHYHDNYKGSPIDGIAWVDHKEDSPRVVRGGSWNRNAWYCRSAFRGDHSPDYRASHVGFRLAATGKISTR